MKALSRTLTTCTAAAALLLATAGVAQAYDPDAPTNDVAEAITAVAPGASDVLATAQANAEKFATANRKLGRDITLSALNAALFVGGAQNVRITSLSEDIVNNDTEAAHCTGIALTLAGVGE